MAVENTDEQKTVDVFCANCNVQTAARVVAEHSRSTLPPFLDVEWTNTEYDIYVYNIAACGRCESVFLVESKVWCNSEYEVPQDQRVLYPSPSQVSMDGIPAIAARPYLEAAGAFNAGLYRSCAVMSRTCVEAVCHEFGETKGSLNRRLSNLRESGKIDQKLLEWAHQLRSIGNDAAHDLEIVIEQVDAKDTLDFVEAILMYVFTLTTRFEEFKRRHNRTKP